MSWKVSQTFIDRSGVLHHAGDTWPPAGQTADPEIVKTLDGSEGRPALIAPEKAEAATAKPARAKGKK